LQIGSVSSFSRFMWECTETAKLISKKQYIDSKVLHEKLDSNAKAKLSTFYNKKD